MTEIVENVNEESSNVASANEDFLNVTKVMAEVVVQKGRALV